MSASIQGLMLGGALLAWSGVAYKGWALRRSPMDPAAWAYWFGFLALALNMTMLLPPITRRIDAAVGLPMLAYLLCDTVALLACWIWLVCLYQLNKPDAGAARMVRWGGALVLGALAFFALRFTVAPGQAQHRIGTSPQAFYLGTYRLIFVGIIALHAAYTIVLLRRYAAEIERPSLRMRLRFMVVAAALIIGLTVNEALRVVRVPSPEIIGALCFVGAMLTLVIGLTLGQPLSRLVAVARDYLLYWRLYPLWRALYPVNPALSFLPAPRRRDVVLPPDDLTFTLRRQVIEIRDWTITLRPFRQPGTPPPCDAPQGRDKAAATDRIALDEARLLVAALHAWRQRLGGETPAPDFSSPTFAGKDGPARTPGVVAWQDEATHLAQVARHFAHATRADARPGRNQPPPAMTPTADADAGNAPA